MSRILFYTILIGAVTGAGFLLWPHIAKDMAARDLHKSGTVQYALTGTNGKTITERTFGDQFTLVVFGYTQCPDVCPSSLQDMSLALDELGDKSKQVIPVFITIDPERDFGEDLKSYVTNFHSTFIGLSGTPEAIQAAAKAFRVYFKQEQPSPDAPDDYLMSHSASIYLIGPNGQGPLKTFKYGDTPEHMAASIRKSL